MRACVMRAAARRWRLHGAGVFQKRHLSLQTAVAEVPHPDKKRGEDAFLVRDTLVAVADGVGGWAEVGIDPGIYSRKLMERLGVAFDKQPAADVRSLLTTAFDETQAENIQGSTTACALKMEGHTMHGLNLGDSGYMVVRPDWSVDWDKFNASSTKQLQETLRSALVFRSTEQLQGFNCPFQLGSHAETPAHANLHKHEVREGDLVLLATDGVFDNVFDVELLDCALRQSGITRDAGSLHSAPQWQGALSRIAKTILTEVQARARSTTTASPFSVNAQRHGYQMQPGGKMDDITLLVCRVCSDV